MNGKRVVVALSGGVDSAVAALLLHEQGYQVIGATLHLWGNPGESDSEVKARYNDARNICQQLGVKHHLLDKQREFRDTIIEQFAGEYLRGRTPNPCVICNREMKWRLLLELVDELEADFLATGHYARLLRQDGITRLATARDAVKDQSYALWNLPIAALERTLLPLGEFAKKDTRRLAAEMNLTMKDNPESQDICFIPDGNYGGFLEEHFSGQLQDVKPGPLLDEEGNRVGNHRGIPYYTIGQRKGLGVALGKPYFVSAIDPVANTIRITTGEGLYQSGLRAEKANWLMELPPAPFRASARIRYHDSGENCLVTPLTEQAFAIRFDQPRRAITPGQSVVIYDEDIVLGGGIIGESFE